MTTTDLLDRIASSDDLSDEVLRAAVAQADATAPRIIALIEAAAAGADLDEPSATLLFYGLHILAAARNTRALQPLLRLLSRPGEEIDALLGDALTATLPRVVASLFVGDADELFKLARDRGADEYVRSGVIRALAFLTWDGKVEAGVMQDFLERFHTDRAVPIGDVAWAGWQDAIALLGLRALEPRVEAARQDGLIPEDLIDRPWFRKTMQRAAAQPRNGSRFAGEHLGYLEDVADELSWVAGRDEKRNDADGLSSWGSPKPVRNPMRGVGRNDPCPCGSGKKAKKCCLA